MATDTIDILLTDFTPAPPAEYNDGHDLDLTSLDLQLVKDLNRVRQSIGIAVWWFTGEWLFNMSLGVDWYSVLGTKYSVGKLEALVKSAILDVDDVTKITRFDMTWDNVKRKVSMDISVDTLYGTLKVEI